MPWTIKSCYVGQVGQHGAAGPSSLGSSYPEVCNKGGQCHLFSRADLWQNTVPASSVHPVSRVSSRGFLEELLKMEMPATQPLMYAEVAWRQTSSSLDVDQVYIRHGEANQPLAPL